MPLLAQVKRSFFNPSFIGTYLDKKTYQVLNRFGGTVRKTAQFSMRKKKTSSVAGSPPASHKNPLLRKLLFYSLAGDNKSVVVGPLLKESSKRIGIPKLHEEGGTVTSSVKGKTIVSRYPSRPFMQPAFAATLPKVAEWYKAGKK